MSLTRRESARRIFAANRTAAVTLLLMWLVGISAGGYIAAHQRLAPPSWVPLIGQKDFILNAQLETVQGVLPGQGQPVTVSGVNVGTIVAVNLVDGRAVAKLRIKRKFGRVYSNATLLLRPKTGVKDIVAELDPGDPKTGKRLASGALLTIDRTQPDVNFEEILASLDSDTRAALRLLVGGGGRALEDGGGHDLANTFRRFEPLSRHVAEASALVAKRRVRLRRLMGNLSKIAVEFGGRDKQLTRFVSGSQEVFKRFAHQSDSLGETIRLLPPALDSSNRALAKLDGLGRSLDSTLTELRPSWRNLAPTLRKIRPALRATTPVLRDQLRPFAREAQPTARLLIPAARDLTTATPDLRRFADLLNAVFDEMAYDPPGNGVGDQSTLFYVPWAAHNTNSAVANQDGVGPLRRGLVALSCGQLQILDSLIKPPPRQTEPRNPTLTTLIQLFNAPKLEDLVASGQCPKPESAP